MHLIYIANTQLPTERARGLQIMKSCEAFAGQGLDVTLVVPATKNPLGNDPFLYYQVQRTFRIEELFCFNGLSDFFARWFRRAAFHVESLIFGIASVLSSSLRYPCQTRLWYSRDFIPLFLLALFGLPFIAEIHDYRSRSPRWHIKFLLRRARHLVLNSEGTQRALVRHYALESMPVSIIPNGVDTEYFHVAETRDAARAMLGMKWSGLLVGYVGRLETAGKEKGVRELLEAFQIVAQEEQQAKLVVVGGPNDLISEYQKNMAGYPVEFAGQVVYAKIPQYLRAMDVVVIPLPNDQHAKTTSPIKLFESMAAGKSIIASDLPALRAHLNERNAFFFRADDAEDMARVILYVLRAPEEAQNRSLQALRDAERYSWAGRAEKILTALS